MYESASDKIDISNNASELRKIHLPKGKWLLFGSALVKVSNNDMFSSYIVIGDFVNYSFAVAQQYKGQLLLGSHNSNVNVIYYCELSEEKEMYLWAVTDGIMEVSTPNLYALQIG